MDVTVTTGALDSLMASVKKHVERKWRVAGDISEEAAEFGAKTAQSYTSTRPGATTGKAGRVDTGKMVEAIRHERVGFSLDMADTRYGFVGEYEKYFGLQSITGFRHVGTLDSSFIAPTFALRDSRGPAEAFARAQLRSRL
jgi:hypothetical protein